MNLVFFFQAALFFRNSFWGLYLPLTVNSRVTDIWRSYVVEAISGLYGLKAWNNFDTLIKKHGIKLYNYIIFKYIFHICFVILSYIFF